MSTTPDVTRSAVAGGARRRRSPRRPPVSFVMDAAPGPKAGDTGGLSLRRKPTSAPPDRRAAAHADRLGVVADRNGERRVIAAGLAACAAAVGAGGVFGCPPSHRSLLVLGGAGAAWCSRQRPDGDGLVRGPRARHRDGDPAERSRSASRWPVNPPSLGAVGPCPALFAARWP
ncbi:hypothetical protein HBB16_12130 [Pseudonocardia sp. MCCB 268]|nr:hypothetical protein [Pseudonocardia cytotoxica]